MRERINRLARGIVDAELPKIHLSQTSVEETLVSDTTYKRELLISSENNLYIKGLAYSSHTRVKIVNSAFGGLRNHITYEVDTSWCEHGDTINHAYDKRMTVTLKDGALSVFKPALEEIDLERVDGHTYRLTVSAADFVIFTF